MGYTHYWRREKELDAAKYASAVADFQRLILTLEDSGIRLAGPMGDGLPEFTADELAFNGPDDCGHPQNSEISIPWPAPSAGGVGPNKTAVDGSWFAGALLQTRACDGSCSYETFRIPRVTEHTEPDKEGRFFDCCKTAYRPYDIAVTAALIIFKKHFGTAFKVSSDGEDEHWFDAKMLCLSVLGYGIEYVMTDDGLTLNGETEPKYIDPESLKPKPPKPQVRNIYTKEVAVIIRKELKKAFPETKFSVRYKSYSMGSHVSITYEDGPPVKAVEAITDTFYGTGFDGMTDSSTYHNTEWNGETVHFCGSRPSVSRSFTDATIQEKTEAEIRRRINFLDCNEYYLPRQYAWAVLGKYDARWETIPRAVERFLSEGCR